MARFLTFATIAIVLEVVATSEPNSSVAISALRDPKHRSELVDEAFSEQKDVLLEMLEAKLKEVKDKKKKKKSTEKLDLKLDSEQKLCDPLSKDKSLVMKANGISNVGVVNLVMNHGTSGKGHLNLDADGISNVGRAHLELGMEGGANVLGISNSLLASPSRFNSIFCDNKEPKEEKSDVNSPDILPQEIYLKEVSLRKTDVNTSIDKNITKLNANRNETANSTETAVNAIYTPANTAITNAILTNGTTVDTNNTEVGILAASVGHVIPTVTNSSVTPSAPESTVTVLNNLNTVPK